MKAQGTTSESPTSSEVLMLSTFPPRKDGVADYTEELMGRLSAHDPKRYALLTFKEDVGSHRSGSGARPFPLYNELSMRDFGWKVAKAANRRNPRVLHVQSTTFIYPRAFLTFPFFLKKKLALVVTAHDAPGLRQFHTLPFLIPLYSRARVIITLSHSVARSVRSLPFVNPNKVVVLHHGVDTQRFSPEVSPERFLAHYRLLKGPFTFMQPGFVGQGKGQDVLLRAFGRLKKRFPSADFRLVIAGGTRTTAGNRYAKSLSKLRDLLGLEREVVTTGYVPWSLLPSALAAADVLVFPYLGASQSGPLHRGLAMGKPIIVSDVPSFLEVVSDGETGVVVPKGRVQALSEAMGELFTDAAMRDRIGKGARSLALSSLDWEKDAARESEVYSSIIGD